MRKFLVRVLCLLLLFSYGCKKEVISETEQFKNEYNLQSEINVHYLKSEDINYQLTHGTHIIFIGSNSGNTSKNLVESLEKNLPNYTGMTVYYYSNENKDINNEFKELIDLSDTSLEETLIYIKNGEVLEVSSKVEDIVKNLELMKNTTTPGCSETC